MTGVGFGPGPDLSQACREGLAIAAVIDVLNVEHLEAGLVHDVAGIEVRVCGKAGFGGEARPGRVREQAAF